MTEIPNLEAPPELTWFSDSPDVGDPKCICSFCGKPIVDGEDTPCLRVCDTENNTEARFHYTCFVIGAIPLNGHVDKYDMHRRKPDDAV